MQNKRLTQEKKVLEKEFRHAEVPEKTKKLIKQVEKEETLNALLDVNEVEIKKRTKKRDLPTSLRKRLKLNLTNLPTPKDDEYITFTETVSENSDDDNQTEQEDSLNESQWD